MKGFTDCGCGMIGPYKTPWCELIQGGRDINILHLWYKLEWLQNEIEKRSSYLGKFRRTEEAQHLLDLISMTTDEEDMFRPFAKAAMSDVFDVLTLHIPKDKRSFLWDEGRTSYQIDTLPASLSSVTPDADTTAYSGGKITGYLTFGWSDADDTQHKVLVKLKFSCDSGVTEWEQTYEAVWDGTLWKVDIDETPPSAITTLDSADIQSVMAVWKNPQSYNEGDWIDYDGKVYIALSSGDANNMDALMETTDFRHSVHYLLSFPKGWDSNMAEPLDTAVFEALVARIIYKWLQYSYPQESERYLTEYEESLDKISRRSFEMYGQKIVHRIPRMC